MIEYKRQYKSKCRLIHSTLHLSINLWIPSLMFLLSESWTENLKQNKHRLIENLQIYRRKSR